jgi:hypothetical protein
MSCGGEGHTYRRYLCVSGRLMSVMKGLPISLGKDYGVERILPCTYVHTYMQCRKILDEGKIPIPHPNSIILVVALFQNCCLIIIVRMISLVQGLTNGNIVRVLPLIANNAPSR